MKRIILISLSLIALMTIMPLSSSCKKLLSKNVNFDNQEFQFNIKGSGTKAAGSENVLYEGNLNFDVVTELQKHGLTQKNLKSFLMKNGKLELVQPAGFKMTVFNGMKLYFGTQKSLVATVNDVKDNVAIFTINNPDLLDKINEGKLYITVTGPKPVSDVTVKLVADYVANIGLL